MKAKLDDEHETMTIEVNYSEYVIMTNALLAFEEMSRFFASHRDYANGDEEANMASKLFSDLNKEHVEW